MLQNLEELGRRQRDQGEGVVEAQGVVDVELRHLTIKLAAERVVLGRQQDAVGVDLADGRADAAAVLDRHQHRFAAQRRRGDIGHEQVGVGGQVAEIRLFRAHGGAPALEEHVGLAEHVAVGGGDDLRHGIGQRPNLGALAAVGERIAVDDAVAVLVIDAGDAVLVGGVRAVDGLVQAARDDHAVIVELDDQAAEVGVLAVRRHDQGRVAVQIGGRHRVGVGRGIAGAQDVVVVGQQRVGTAGDDDVDAAQQAGELGLQRDLLQVADQDDLVDALGRQVVDDRLQNRGEGGHVVGGGADHRGVARAGNRLQQRRGGADNADQLAVFLDDRGRRDLRGGGGRGQVIWRRLEVRVQQDVAGEQAGQIAVVGKVQIGAEVGKLRAEPAHVVQAGAADVSADDVGQRIGAEVELMVAERRGVEPDDVHDGDVDTARRLADVVQRVILAGRVGERQPEQGIVRVLKVVAQAAVGGGVKEWAGQEVVAGRQRDRVGVLVLELVDDRGEVRRRLNRVHTTLEIRGVEDLKRVRHRCRDLEVANRVSASPCRRRIARRQVTATRLFSVPVPQGIAN